MTSEAPEMPAPPQPTAEHQRLLEGAGVWNVACEFYMDPSQPPMKVQAKETVEAFGGFWRTSIFESEMFGQPFRGKATLGYEPATAQYVSTWIDTMTPSLYHFTGGFDAEGRVLEMKGRGVDCSSGGMTDYRTVEELVGPDERRFEMFMTMPDGNEIKLFTYVYTRAR